MYNFIKKANLILDGKFVFDRQWDMESDIRIVQNENLNWDLVPFDDDEWNYMLHRMEYLIDIAKAFEITRDCKYKDHIIMLILDWQQKNIDKLHNLRSIDTGIRLLNWAESYAIIGEKPNKITINAIQKMSNNLIERYRLKDDLSNWGIFQSIGCLCFEQYLNEQSIVFWKEKLFHQLELQINPEGFHWENSIMYHNQILLSLCRVSKLNNIDLRKYIEKMSRATSCLMKPNFNQIMQNDSDDTSVGGLLQFASEILGNDTYKNPKNDQTSKLYTHEICKESNINMKVHYPQTGLIAQRTNDKYISIHNHAYGSSHSHIMPCHINYYINDDILIDPGRYTYMDVQERYQLKSIKSHNSPIIISKLNEKIINSWDTKVNVQTIHNNVVWNDDYMVATVSYCCDDHLILRRVIYVDDTLVVIDKYSTWSDVHGQVNLTFGKTVEFNEKMEFWNKYKLVHNYDKITCEKALYSPHYNKLERTNKVVLESRETKINFFTISQISSKIKYSKIENYHLISLETENLKLKICVLTEDIKIGSKITKIGKYSINGKLVLIDELKDKIIKLEM